MNTPIYADLDQIVFDGRSKDYGAYQMRDRYNQVLTRATLIAFLLFISITVFPKMIDWISSKEIGPIDPSTNVLTDSMISIHEIEFPVEPEVEAIKIPEPPMPEIKTVAALIPNPTPEDQLRDEAIIAEVSDFDSAAVGLVTQDGKPGEDYNWTDVVTCKDCKGTGPETDVVIENTDKTPKSTDFILLEKEPSAVNMDDLQKLIGYPALAKEAGIEGKVVFRVLIDKYGNYKQHIVLREAHPILSKAVAAHIGQLKMTPGIQAGRPISVWVTLPFDFKLLN